jgi:hypothetical protein
MARFLIPETSDNLRPPRRPRVLEGFGLISVFAVQRQSHRWSEKAYPAIT